MQPLITSEESEILEKISLIDPEKDAFEIIENPSKYFDKYFAQLHNPASILFAHANILFIVIKLDTSQDIADKTVDYFLAKMSPEQWIDTLMNFYAYILSLISFVLINHNDILLDLYNENKMSKHEMEKGMKAFVEAKKRLLSDEKDTQEHIEVLKKEKEKLNNAPNDFDDPYNPNSPYNPSDPYNPDNIYS